MSREAKEKCSFDMIFILWYDEITVKCLSTNTLKSNNRRKKKWIGSAKY